MKKIIFLMSCMLCVFSCIEKQDLNQSSDSLDSTGISRQMAGDGLYDVLGFGYDVTEVYLAPGSIRNMVVDINQLVAENPYKVYNNASTYGYNMLVLLN